MLIFSMRVIIKVQKKMKANFKSDTFDLGVNSFVDTTQKVAVAFLLDISESMSWYGGLMSMQDGIKVFIDTLKDDPYALASVEVAIYIFNHEVVQLVDFKSVDKISLPTFSASGGTQIAPAVELVLNDLEAKSLEYKKQKLSRKAPWLVLLTDADISEDIDSVVKRTSSKVNAKELTLFAIGTGDEVNIQQLKRFNPKSPVIFSPTGEDLVPLFEWLSQSTAGYSQSAEGESFKTDPLDRRYEIM